MSSNKVAVITGGASGMGFAVAQSLSTQTSPPWTLHILDLNPSRGESAASTLKNTTFHQTDVTKWTSLSDTFAKIHTLENRIDFVFANAGIAEHHNFFSHPTPAAGQSLEEPKGMNAIIDINLKSVINTAYLSHYYMSKSPASDDKNIVITSSCGALYPSYYSPVYTASKHAVLGFMRSIAPSYYKTAGIRVNAICPGTVKTNLLTSEEWSNFPEAYFTPVEKIAEVVVMLVSGKDDGKRRGKVGDYVKDGMEKGDREELGVLKGKAVEICGWKHYYREQVGFCDEGMERVMGATDIEVLEGATDVGVPGGK